MQKLTQQQVTQKGRIAFGLSLLGAMLLTVRNKVQQMAATTGKQAGTTKAANAVAFIAGRAVALCPASAYSINRHESSPTAAFSFCGADWKNGQRIRGDFPLVANG